MPSGTQVSHEPDQPRVQDEVQIGVAVRRTFTSKEMQAVEKGRMAFTCQFDSAGRIENIHLSHLQGFALSDLNKELLQLNLRKYVRLYVPKSFK